MAQDTVVVTGALAFQKFVAHVLYKHVAYCSATKPSEEPAVLFWDYMRCNFVNDVYVGAVQSLAVTLMQETSEIRSERDKIPVRVFPFLGKLFLGRVLVDIVYYIVHRWLHTDYAYKMIHQRHHEHTAPRPQTSLHFTSVDLFLEAPLPVFVALFALKGLGIDLNPIEELWLSHFYFYFDIAAHTGKEAPLVTWFPPLSPIVDAITNVDQRLVEYHTRHHQIYNCNYSISPWPDMLMGTYRMEYKVKDEKSAV